jgi:hypothetical protein
MAGTHSSIPTAICYHSFNNRLFQLKPRVWFYAQLQTSKTDVVEVNTTPIYQTFPKVSFRPLITIANTNPDIRASLTFQLSTCRSPNMNGVAHLRFLHHCKPQILRENRSSSREVCSNARRNISVEQLRRSRCKRSWEGLFAGFRSIWVC